MKESVGVSKPLAKMVTKGSLTVLPARTLKCSVATRLREHDMSADELNDIGDNYVNIVDKLMLEIMCDAISYDGLYTSTKFVKLKGTVREMKTPLYPGCKEKWPKLFTTFKLLQCHPLLNQSWLQDIVRFAKGLRDMLSVEMRYPLPLLMLRRLSAFWEYD